jgi:hypothetical protein
MHKIELSQVTALGLAFVVTASLLAGLDQLATRQHAANEMARINLTSPAWLARTSSVPCS